MSESLPAFGYRMTILGFPEKVYDTGQFLNHFCKRAGVLRWPWHTRKFPWVLGTVVNSLSEAVWSQGVLLWGGHGSLRCKSWPPGSVRLLRNSLSTVNLGFLFCTRGIIILGPHILELVIKIGGANVWVNALSL